MRALKLLLVAAILSLLGVQGASAQFYIGGHLGTNFTHDTTWAGVDLDFDPGFAGGFVAGYRVTPNLRFDGEITYRENDLSDFIGNVNSIAFLANAYYDFTTGSPWVPYVGAGLGFATVELDSGLADDDDVFAYQLGVGVAYEFTPSLALSLDYRFMGTEDPDYFGSSYEYRNSTIQVGLRFTF